MGCFPTHFFQKHWISRHANTSWQTNLTSYTAMSTSIRLTIYWNISWKNTIIWVLKVIICTDSANILKIFVILWNFNFLNKTKKSEFFIAFIFTISHYFIYLLFIHFQKINKLTSISKWKKRLNSVTQTIERLKSLKCHLRHILKHYEVTRYLYYVIYFKSRTTPSDPVIGRYKSLKLRINY